MNDEVFYEAVVEELERQGPKKGLWAKAFAAARGNESAAKAHYLEWRVEQLKAEYFSFKRAQQERAQQEAAARAQQEAAARAQREAAARAQQEAAAREAEGTTTVAPGQAISPERLRRFRSFVLMLRGLGLPFETVIMQLESKGLSVADATRLAKEVLKERS